MRTKEQAIALAESDWWKDLPAVAVAGFQLFEDRLCMPFDEFHKAVEEALGRPVWTHEFADRKHLRDEYQGKRKPPTFEEILDMIPAGKRVLIVTEEAEP
jgi:hypothetical protein